MFPVYCGRTQRAKPYPKIDGVETIPAWSRGALPWKVLSPMILGPFNVLEPVVQGYVIMYRNQVPFLVVRFNGTISPGYQPAQTTVEPFSIHQTMDQGNNVTVHYHLTGTGQLQIGNWQLLENYWQYGKIYQADLVTCTDIDLIQSELINSNTPELSYTFWTRRAGGVSSTTPTRRTLPKAKYGTPICSFYHYSIMDYVYSRNQVYIPYYKELASKTAAYQELVQLHQTKPLLLVGPDGLDHTDSTGIHYDHTTTITRQLWDRWRQDPTIIFGHELVLVGMLQGWV